MNQKYLLFFWQKKQCFYILFLLFLSSSLFAQEPVKVSGTVISSDDGLPLPGVGVKIKDTSIGTVTDIEGKYALNVNKGQTLIFSFISFTPKEVLIGDKTTVNVSLNTSIKSLNEVVVNGFFTQKKSEVTGAVSTISGEEILKSPVTNVTNALIGKIPGVIAQQSSGRPGNNQADLYIRGRVSPQSAALIIVDGVERETFGDIDPNEIESFTVLKDAASTALYGLKGANGVFVVTTKSGKQGKAKVSFVSNAGIVSPTELPGFLPAFESATLHTEGQINIGQSANRLFSDRDLEIFKYGPRDPLLYPDVNWYKALTRPNWMQTQQNVSISGGSKVATYFTSFGYTFENGMFKEFKSPSGYKTTPSYNRYNFRSNVDINLTKTTKVGVKVAGRLENRYSLQGNSNSGDTRTVFANGLEGLVSRILAVPAWGLPFFSEYTNSDNPEIQKLDATYNHIEDYPTLGVNTYNPYAMMTRQGYASYDKNVIESIITVDQRLDKITKGLSFKGLFGYDAQLGAGKRQNGGFAAYNLNKTTKELTVARNSSENALGGIAAQRYGYIKTTVQLSLAYKRTFGKNNVAANFFGTRDLKGAEGVAAPFANQGLVYSLAYNYGEKYFIQASGSYNGSENYPAGKRYGFFPAVSAAYTISQEDFLKDVTWLDLLKVRGSIGLVGIINAGSRRFLYIDAYARGGSVAFGTPGSSSSVPTYRHSEVGNPFVTWEKSLKRNIGFESSFFKNRLEFNFDIFDDTRYDVIFPRNNTSFATYGESLPNVNYGEYYNRGYEASITHINRVGKFGYSISPNITYAKNQLNIVDEADKLPGFQKTVGQSIGQLYGYKVLGFYKDVADIAASPTNKLTAAASIPGDLKYADLNNDGVISGEDQTNIGFADIPEYVLGLNMNMSYRGFSISALLQGVTNVSSDLVFTSGNRNQYYEPMLGRWRPDHQDATWPAIRPGATPNPNDVTNDFLLQDASYIKLRNVELRYTFNSKITRKLRVSGLSLFASGQNIKTWTKFYGLDPENYTNTSAFAIKQTTYPTTKVVNFGLSVQF